MRLSALANQIFVEDTENGVSGNGDGKRVEEIYIGGNIWSEAPNICWRDPSLSRPCWSSGPRMWFFYKGPINVYIRI